jgi:hypothetical protein
MKNTLKDEWGFNIYSQWGEDGIIQKITQLINLENKLCIEFGAWDGIKYSNVCNLWMNDWKAYLIESDPDKFSILETNTKNYNTININKKISVENINDILPGNYYPLISIDIDGDDYHILKAMQFYVDVLIIEYNPTFPKHIEYINKPGDNFGSSALSIVKLAESKNYTLVSITDTNLIFVQNQYRELFNKYEISFDKLFIDKYLCNLCSNYSGNYILTREPVYGINKRIV